MADVVVVGAGNAAFAAAVSAAEQGARVTVLERAPEPLSGGNTRFTAGAMRFAYDGVDDLRRLMPDLTDEEVAATDFGAYGEAQFFEDMGRVTEYRTDPDLCELLVKGSKPTMQWMAERGLHMMGRRAPDVDSRQMMDAYTGIVWNAWAGPTRLKSTRAS